MHMAAYPLCDSSLRDVLKNYLCNPEEFSDTKVYDHAAVTIIEGPRFSTKAESFMHKSWGSDLVGMTLLPEAIMAKKAGLVFASIALVTDYSALKKFGSTSSINFRPKNRFFRKIDFSELHHIKSTKKFDQK